MKLSNFLKPKTEIEIQKSILDGLEKLRVGSFNRINNAPIFDQKLGIYRKKSSHTPDGISDIIGCYKGKYICIEVKTVCEYKKVIKLLDKNDMNKFIPKNKWEKRIKNQFLFIQEKINNNGYGFFTYSLEHTLENLQERIK